MPDRIHQIVYMSRATAPLDGEDIVGIRTASQANNARRGITGLLLYDGARFIQALEGAHADVSEVMDQISRDPRHTSIAYVHRGPIARRQFGDWAMDVRHIEVPRDAHRFLDTVKRAVVPVEDLRLIATFIGFAVMGRPELRGDRGYHAAVPSA